MSASFLLDSQLIFWLSFAKKKYVIFWNASFCHGLVKRGYPI
jgi:hypothetical protein